jgi:hypothetical protein
MILPDVLKSFETYKDFITNGLDLVSFTIGTPHVLRLIGPPIIKRGVRRVIFVIWSLIGGASYFVFFYFVLQMFRRFIDESPVWLQYIEGFACIILAFSLFAFAWSFISRVLIAILSGTGTLASRHAFLVGVLLFFLSRAIAFLVATYELFSVPGGVAMG